VYGIDDRVVDSVHTNCVARNPVVRVELRAVTITG